MNHASFEIKFKQFGMSIITQIKKNSATHLKFITQNYLKQHGIYQLVDQIIQLIYNYLRCKGLNI